MKDLYPIGHARWSTLDPTQTSGCSPRITAARCKNEETHLCTHTCVSMVCGTEELYFCVPGATQQRRPYREIVARVRSGLHSTYWVGN